MNYNEYKELFRFLLPNNNGSFELIWNMLWDIRLLKFIKQSDIKLINKDYSKICSKEKFKELSKLGFLSTVDDEIYSANDSVLAVLKEAGRNTKILPQKTSGRGSLNELNNTKVFIDATKLPDYFHLFYPRFPNEKPYIIPDALLVLKSSNKYKLVFLEVEASKSNWDNWLDNKRTNYLILASDIKAYNYWCNCCEKLKWSKPKIDEFKFSVCIIGNIKKDWGEFFNFRESLCT